MQAESSPTFEQKLLDIELPVQPDIDWSTWLHVGLALLVLVLVLWGMKRLRDHFGIYFRLQRKIKRALEELNTSVKRADSGEPLHDLGFQAYQWFDQARQHELLGEKAKKELKVEIDRLCFSRQQQVSHETMERFLQAFQHAMTESMQHRPRWYQALWRYGCYVARSLTQSFAQKDGDRHD